VLKPFTFSNGFTAPAGSTVTNHLYALHHDEDIYHDPDQFNPFRWLEGREAQKEEDGEGKRETAETKKTMYTTSKTYLTFGHGKNAW
jgi:cytochrome P450